MDDTATTDSPMADSVHRSIAALSAAQACQDPLTVRHQERVADLAVAIGTELGLSRRQLAVLRLAAVVHDIGKMAIPPEILGKPGALSETEYAQVKAHCGIGFGILRALGSSLPIAEIAYQHHERLDGSGYPRGLSGDQIILEARIVSVADVYDAMSSDRPYRAGMAVDVALEQLHAMAGRLLDIDAVEACERCVLESLPRHASGQGVRPSFRGAPGAFIRASNRRVNLGRSKST
jgi:putative nucleotidyltransferase with HDIG domain